MARSLPALALLALALAAAPPAFAGRRERDRNGGDMQPGAPDGGDAGGAPAEDAPGGEPSGPPEGAAAAPAADNGDGGGPPPSGQAGGGENPAPTTLADAKANIGTIIQAFFAKRSVDGALPLRDKTTKRLRRLQLVKVDDRHVAEAGGSRYAAPASLKDLESGQTLQASFTVDFGGSDWRVVGMRLKPAAARAKR